MTTPRSDEGTRSGLRRLGGALALIAVSTAVLVGVIALDVHVNGFLAGVVGLVYPLIVLYAFAVRPDTGGNPRFRKNAVAWGLGVSAVGFVAYLAGTEAWANLILGSGRTVQAVVVGEEVTNVLHDSGRVYTLASAGSADAVPGGPLAEDSRRFGRGDVVTVRMDPAGRVAPKLPGEADSPAALLLFLGCNVLIDGTVLWSVRRTGPSPA
ncbi:hypothetical protein [Streptomyces sp. CBMA156]|uniref:hypothetical protein n=1 Tax=Streptomyces sp. CBMA156 TaxID=1930280 RepID=UPI001661F07D|nr:hypothetical protein [Streptomyces sp. CBMA156]MBD0675043.1 hypothetical protein [Streptomyces sp. CBMA156]